MAWLTHEHMRDMGFARFGNDVMLSDKASYYNCKNMRLGSNVRVADFCNIFFRVAIYSSNDDYRGGAMTNPTVPAEYVELAVRLGTDVSHRDQIKAKIHAAKHVLYEDVEVVKALEGFFRAAVEKRW